MESPVKFICFDTATDALACALWSDGEIVEHHEMAPRRHADRVLSIVERLLGEAGVARDELDAVGFGRGPGSFTGLRVATGVAQGLAFALDVPAVPVSTLAAIAQGSLREHGSRNVLSVLDARLGEVYAGAFRARAGVMRPVGRERLCRPEALGADVAGNDGWTGCGSGWGVFANALASGLPARPVLVEPERLPRGRDVAALVLAGWNEGRAVSPERALPVYLRRRVASPPASRAVP